MHQPALLSFIFFGVGIIFGYLFDISLPYIIVVLLGLCLVYLIFFIVNRTHRVLNYFISILLILGGFFFYEVRTTIFPENHIKELLTLDDELELICEIAKDPEHRLDRTVLECAVDTVIYKGERFHITGKVLVSLRFPTPDFEYRQRIRVHGYLWYPDFPRNPRAFDYLGYLKRRTIYGAMNIWSSQDVVILSKERGNPIISHISLPIKRFIEKTIDDNLSGDQGALLKGITIGERGLISNRVKNMFANTGVLHVLAVSGLHVGIIATILFVILQVLRVPFNFSLLVAGLVLLIYALMVDLRYSVVRATLITVFMMGALASERNTRLLNIIACAGLLILFINPQSLFDTSFQLSFLAVGSIIYLYPRIYPLLFGFIKNKEGFSNKWIARPLAVSLCAQAGSTPLIAYYFFKLPIISIIANLIVIPLIGVSIALGFATAFFYILPWKLLTHLFAAAAFASTSLTLKTVDLFNSIPYGHMWVRKPCILFLIFYYVILFLAVNAKTSMRARKGFIYVTLIAANVFCWTNVHRVYNPKLTVTFLDVGYGDAAFVQYPNGKKVLIDGGCWSKAFDAGEKTIAPYLHSHGIRDLDFVIITSPKIQYIGGLKHILKNFKVKEIVGYGAPYSSWAYLDLLRYINYKDITYRVCEAGDKIDEIGLAILGSGKDKSLAFKIRYGKISFLFPEEIKEWRGDNVTILKVPSHGSKYYSALEFVSSVAPEVAVVSVGRNRFGHPDPDVIRRYEEVGAKILRTDEVGAVIIETDGKNIWIYTAKGLYENESIRHKILRYMGLTL